MQNLGYAIPNPKKPLIVSPHLFGIPQERNRVFIPGVRKDLIKNKIKYIKLDLAKYYSNAKLTRNWTETHILNKKLISVTI